VTTDPSEPTPAAGPKHWLNRNILGMGLASLFSDWNHEIATATKAGKLRLLYEANPMSFIVEQADGVSSTGRERILDIQPQGLHQRVPVILGSKNEVERVIAYHKV